MTDFQKQSGFIRIEYDIDDLQKIITNNEIVIATDKEKVIGYYLIGRKSSKIELNYQKNKAFSLFETTEIPFESIGFGCQVCIDENYRNNGLFGRMLNTLVDGVKEKYSHLLCSVSDDNVISLKTHIGNGWQLLDSFENIKYFIYKIHNPIIN